MIIESKEKPLTKKITQGLEEDSGYCSDCDYNWCSNRAKVVYCSMKFKGIRVYHCLENNCSIFDQ